MRLAQRPSRRGRHPLINDSRAESLILNASSNFLFQHYLWHDCSCSLWGRPASILFPPRGMHTAFQEPTSISRLSAKYPFHSVHVSVDLAVRIAVAQTSLLECGSGLTL